MNILEYENYREKIERGEDDFPYLTYPCSIPVDFIQVPIHWHEEMEFIYIKKGSGMVSVDFSRYEVDAGTIVMILPGQLHAIEQLGDCAMEYENIIFHPDLVLSKTQDICNLEFLYPLFDGNLPIPVVYKRGMPLYEEVTACIDANDEIRKTFPKGYPLYLKSQLLMLFYYLTQQTGERKAGAKEKKSLEYLKVILKYVENHYMERITIAEAARETGLSESHFMKYFKGAMGMSFIEYLNDYRLVMAARLLRASDTSVLVIAEEVGYENLSYFNRVFKRKYHLTPSKYRKLV